MASPWSTKGAKSPPLVSADEFMILDSEDATLSTKNKRVTLTTVQSNLVTSVDANDFNITKLNSISINDSANDNTFTISSSANLAADRTVNLPLLTANDTFAMLGVGNVFTNINNTFANNIEVIPSSFSFSSLSVYTSGTTSSIGAFYRGKRSRGTLATPLTIRNDDAIFNFIADGFDGSDFVNCGQIVCLAAGDFTAAPVNRPTKISIETCPIGGASSISRLLVGSEGETSFQDNIIQDIASIKLNDVSDDNVFTILGAELAGNFDVTIPAVTANDTFAMLGISQTFTGANTWTDDLVQLEDNTLQNANFKGEIYSTSTVQQTSFQGFRAAGTKAIPAATTSGSVFVDLEAVGFNGTIFSVGGSARFIAPATWSGTSTPTTFSIFTTDINSINDVENLVIGADGTADFKGNNITNAVIQSTLTDGSILIGNESNVSKDFSTGLEVKADCVVATTVSGTLATSFENGDVIDTVTLATADRILIKDQDTATENGIYTVNNTGPPTRAADANEDSEVNNGMFTKITSGSANINTAFVLSTPDDITLGTTDLTFDEFSFSDIAQLNSSQTFTGTNQFNEFILLESETAGLSGAVVSTMFTNALFAGPGFIGRRAGGTKATPLAVVDGDFLVELQGNGFDGVSFSGGFGFVCVAAAGTWSSSPVNKPTKVLIATATAGPSPQVLDRIIVGSEGETSFQDNIIQDIKSIKLNDSDDTHSYTILGGDLSNDFNVTIPTIDANDTFALLNVANTFTQRQIITIPLSSVVDGLSVGNADGQLVLGNNTADVGEFAPLLSLTSKGSDNPSTIQSLIAVVDDTGTTPLSVVNVLRVGGAAVTTRPLWEIQNNGVKQVSVAANGDWDFQGNSITNIADPSVPQDGATKNYVDSTSGINGKALVRVATVVAGTLATSFENGDTIDGVVLVTGDRILIKDQATASENGIYTVNASGNPTRATDADSNVELKGAAAFITEGTTNSNLTFVQTKSSITVDTDDITFIPYSNLVAPIPFGNIEINVPDASFDVTIVTQDTYVVIGTTNWIEPSTNSNFTSTTAGVLTYTGEDTRRFKVDLWNNGSDTDGTGGQQDVTTGVFLNGSAVITASEIRNSPNGGAIAKSFVVSLSTSDTLDIRVKNLQGTDDVEISNVGMMLTQLPQ